MSLALAFLFEPALFSEAVHEPKRDDLISRWFKLPITCSLHHSYTN